MGLFTVTILGCSSATPTADRHPSAQVVSVNDSKILIDCGEGTQNQMLRYHIRYNKIDTILISHLHGDHFLGLPGLLSTMSLNGRQKKLLVIGPAALEALMADFLKVSETQLQYEIEYRSTNNVEPEIILEAEHFSVSSFPLKHRIPCTGFIISEKKDPRKILVNACVEHDIPLNYYQILKRGKDYQALDGTIIPNNILTIATTPVRRYAYCSDSIYDPTLVPVLSEVDLLYHEATFAEALVERAMETWHSTARQAALIAKAALVKQLIIGHFSARYHNLEELLNEAQSEFREVSLALEGKEFNL